MSQINSTPNSLTAGAPEYEAALPLPESQGLGTTSSAGALGDFDPELFKLYAELQDKLLNVADLSATELLNLQSAIAQTGLLTQSRATLAHDLAVQMRSVTNKI